MNPLLLLYKQLGYYYHRMFKHYRRRFGISLIRQKNLFHKPMCQADVTGSQWIPQAWTIWISGFIILPYFNNDEKKQQILVKMEVFHYIKACVQVLINLLMAWAKLLWTKRELAIKASPWEWEPAWKILFSEYSRTEGVKILTTCQSYVSNY